MSERQQIIYMQVRMMRLAAEEWKQPVEEVAGVFTRYDILQYIEDCFGIFHVEGDEAVLEDITVYLKNRGVEFGAAVSK